MGYICKLTRGALTLNLNSTPYSLAYGFAPPAILETASIATGGSTNRYGGGKKIDERVLPRDYAFTVRILGGSNAQCEQAIDRLDTFLRSGSDADPVYFCFKPDNNISHEPLWGQFGATRRCKVLSGHCEKSGEIYGDVRDRAIFADVSLTINGVDGRQQRAGTARGGIIENTMFSPDGISRGLMIPEATTNLSTNPVFGHATPENGWTTGAGVLSVTNTDKAFVYPGAVNSIKLTRIAGAPIVFYQALTLTVATYTISAYVKKADGTVTTDNDIQIYYIDAKASTHTYMGNGITRVSWTGTGNAAEQAAGISLATVGTTIYLMGYQVELKAYPTPLCWGDLMGCAWTGTAHASTSTREVAEIVLSTPYDPGEGTFVFVWQPDRANTTYSANSYLLWGPDFKIYFDQANDRWVFTDDTNTINGNTHAFSALSIQVLHFVFEAGSLKIYRNGSQDATGSTYTPAAVNDLFLGSDNAPANHIGGTLLGFHSIRYAISSTEAANDYANIYQHVSGGDGYGQQLESIPWLYSFNGDNECSSYNDATHHDWIIVGGINGSLPANTLLTTVNSADNRSLIIANYQSSIFHSPSDYFSAADATAAALNTTAALGKAINVAANIHKDLYQYPVHIWASLHDHGANLTIAPRVELSTSNVGYTGDYRSIIADTTNKDFLTYGINNIENPEILTTWSDMMTGMIVADSIDYELWLKRSVDGAQDVTIDYMQVMFGALTYIYNDVASNSSLIVINGNKVYLADNYATPIVAKITSVQGDIFELHPNTLNHIVMLTGTPGINTVTAATTDIQYIDITPRWALA